jgi:hypothetical protein
VVEEKAVRDEKSSPGVFQMLSFNELVISAQPCLEPDPVYWETFNKKDESPGSS